MKFGLCIPHYGKSLSMEELRTTVQMAEGLGFHSVWVSDHVVTPEHLQPTVGPTFYDPFVVLTCAAAFSTRLKLGTTVVVVPYRNPLVVAKMVATLDALSGGRVIFGVGAGGAPDEFQALGVPSEQRGRRTDEYLRVMLALWTQDPTSFRGRYFSFSVVRFGPKPFQSPHPPIWVGGRSDAALRRAVRIGQAWHPTSMAMDSLKERMSRLESMAREAGRTDGPEVTIHQFINLEEDPRDEGRRPGRGTPQQIVADMGAYEALGIPVVVCNFASQSVQEHWGAVETFAAQVMPHVSQGA